jgi:hypothetical protein
MTDPFDEARLIIENARLALSVGAITEAELDEITNLVLLDVAYDLEIIIEPIQEQT